MKTPHKNDAAPLAGGAGVNGRNTSSDLMLAWLPLMPPARKNAPETSRIAAGRIAGHAGPLRAAVLAMLLDRGEHGATDQEIQDALNLTSDTEVPRRWELAKAGAVVASGRNRKTRSNRPATVWIAVTFATPAPGASADAAGPEGGAA
jgi:hypothetical protein